MDHPIDWIARHVRSRSSPAKTRLIQRPAPGLHRWGGSGLGGNGSRDRSDPWSVLEGTQRPPLDAREAWSAFELGLLFGHGFFVGFFLGFLGFSSLL